MNRLKRKKLANLIIYKHTSYLIKHYNIINNYKITLYNVYVIYIVCITFFICGGIIIIILSWYNIYIIINAILYKINVNHGFSWPNIIVTNIIHNY